MPCSHLAAVGCLATVIGSAALSAQTPAPASPTPAAAEAPPLSMKPFSRVFAYPLPELVADVKGLRLGPKDPTLRLGPEKICGMKVLRPDANIDPKFESPLRDTRTRFTMRIVPMLCR
jgi:hypothetical protein